jgi:chromatin remodeling complex protein RSC6
MIENEISDNYVPDLKCAFDKIIGTLGSFKLQITELQNQIRIIEKNVKKQSKNLKKQSKIPNKQLKSPSGFAKPKQVTKELCEFMNKPIGTEMARTEVTKSLINYIKTNNLQEHGKTSYIIPDVKLQNLLGISNEQIPNLTFFTMQKYMNKHFVSDKNVINNG